LVIVLAGHHHRRRYPVSIPLRHRLGREPVSAPYGSFFYIHRRRRSVWAFYVPLFGTLVVLGLLYWKRHSHPANLGFLALFTLMEAFTLGVVCAFYDTVIVLQALLITTGVFLGLTLFTLQSKVSLSVCILAAR
jgi:FtsH-binding integral membrane protein